MIELVDLTGRCIKSHCVSTWDRDYSYPDLGACWLSSCHTSCRILAQPLKAAHLARCSGTDGRVGWVHPDRLHLCATCLANPSTNVIIYQGDWPEPLGSSRCVWVMHLPSSISASAPHLSRNSVSLRGRVFCARPSVERPAPFAARHSIIMAAVSRARSAARTWVR